MWETVSILRVPEFLCVVARVIVATAWNGPYTGWEIKVRTRNSVFLFFVVVIYIWWDLSVITPVWWYDGVISCMWPYSPVATTPV